MKKLAQLSIVNRAVITLLCVVILGAGLFASTQLKQELFPDLTMPGGSVTVTYPGATGEAIETDVTEPIETALRGVPGITDVTSTSETGLAQIDVQWEYERNATDMESQVRQAVARTEGQLPEDAESTVNIGSMNDFPVLVLSVASDHDPGELAGRLEDQVVPDLKDIPGVRTVQVSGQRSKQVEITAKPTEVDRLGVDLTQLQEVFKGQMSPVPAGSISSENGRVNVEVGDTLESAEDIAELRLQGKDGPVRLGDIADVELIDAPATTHSRVNGRDALSIVVIKSPDANTVQVANAVTDALPGLANSLGGNTEFNDVFNQAPYIEDSIENLATDGVLGLIMAVAVILLFLWSGRSTIITGVSIPLSLLIAVVALFIGEHTLNLITLSALTISVGRVVDDSIVVIENINRHRGLTPLKDFGPEVITRAVGEVGTAVASSTLITVAVFLPIGMVGGQTGELFRPFALTSIVALLGSLLVALVVVPVLSYWFLRPTNKELAAETKRTVEARRAGTEDDLAAQMAEKPSRMQKAYLPALKWSLAHRWVTLALATVIFIGSMAMSSMLRTEFMGDSGENTVTIQQTLPKGSTLEKSDAEAKRIEKILAAEPEVETYQVSVGGGMSEMGGAGDNNVSYSLTLTPEADSTELGNRLRDKFEENPDSGDFMISSGGGTAGSQDITVQIEGNDAEDLETATNRLTAKLEEIEGLADIRSDFSQAETLLQVDVDERAAADLGMSQSTVGLAVNEAVQGTTLGDITTEHGTTEVLLRSREPVTDRRELENLELPVTEKQNADARKAITDEVERRQEELTAEQEAQSEEEAEKQKQELEDSRAELQQQLNDARSQLSEARRAEQQGPQLPPGGMTEGGMPPGLEGMPGGSGVEQLEESVEQLEEQMDQLDEQTQAMQEQEAQAEEQKAQSEEIEDLSKEAEDAEAEPKKVSDVAEVVEATTPSAITRTNGTRTITITATPTSDDLGALNMQVQEAIASTDFPLGVETGTGGVTAEQDEAFGQLWLAMGVAIAMVYIIMVATFRSMLQPLLLLVSVPFAATGVIGILLVTDTALGLPAMIGLLMLIGIVVTNAIVLIDLINTYRSRGSDLDDAVIHGARLRLRPIVMTALATIMGLAPMASGLTGQSIFISQSLALVVIGGLVSSTLLTLILVPVLYHLLESRILKRAERKQAKREEALREDDEDDDPGSLVDVGLADEAEAAGATSVGRRRRWFGRRK